MRSRSKDKRNFITSFKDCINGLEFVIVNEDNFKREIILGIIALILSFILKVSIIEFIIILFVIASVLICEVINTSIEKTVDLCTKEYNETARIAKDIAAFSVLLTCFFAVVIGVVIFVPKIINLLGGI